MLRNRAKRSLFLYLLLQLGIAVLERDEMGKERRTAKEGRLKKINWVGGGGDSKGAGWKWEVLLGYYRGEVIVSSSKKKNRGTDDGV
jgi:hypothetical protein